MKRATYRCKCVAVNTALWCTRGVASIMFDEMTAGLMIRVISMIRGNSLPPVV